MVWKIKNLEGMDTGMKKQIDKIDCKKGCAGCEKFDTCPVHNHKESIDPEKRMLDYIFGEAR